MPVHIGQAHVPAAEPEGALRVVQTECMQHGCVQVVHFHTPINHVKTKFIRLPIGDSALDTTPAIQMEYA
jgi:hypothetical protein